MTNDKGFIPAAGFNILTPLFDTLCSIIGLGKEYRKRIIKNLPIEKDKLKILDAGCGTGSLAIELKKLNSRLVLYGIDADSNILDIAKKKAKEKNLSIYYQQGVLEKLPFPNEYFDVVYSSLVLHHLGTREKQEALNEIYRVLRKDGLFLLVDFGKPKNKVMAIFSLFSVIFEMGYDNYIGKIPKMLKEAKFKSIEKVDEYRYNIHFLIAKKRYLLN
ncbi:MAG: class I SAM-dependent methyltransferase [Nanoarchaeota archaeon]